MDLHYKRRRLNNYLLRFKRFHSIPDREGGFVKANGIGYEIHMHSALCALNLEEKQSTTIYTNFIPNTNMLTLFYKLPNNTLFT